MTILFTQKNDKGSRNKKAEANQYSISFIHLMLTHHNLDSLKSCIIQFFVESSICFANVEVVAIPATSSKIARKS